ncbi:hypothetical protein C8N46_104302 [Kordia periserrulae]|uniref:7(1) septoil knot domain-containing protein n=1 Tax=Kordia periserrulae TaxID=701523 RepID=A0A2T6C015_9FLAO|nr:hypothetical protein [Kordia periserrulae]PTX61658.1 hypothetical protein C8N46_104302 [Kordia periserrulae]
MKNYSNIIILVFIATFCISASTPKTQNDDCTFEGKKLYGKIRFVENRGDADVKIKIVNSFADIKVKLVENFADDCGEWQVVEYGEDLKVYVAESFADIKVKFVTSFPGMD